MNDRAYHRYRDLQTALLIGIYAWLTPWAWWWDALAIVGMVVLIQAHVGER